MNKSDPRIPDQYVDTLWDIDFEDLFSRGYRSLIIDVDNTIACRDSNRADPGAEKVIRELLDSDKGWKICLVSNIILGKKREMRVKEIGEQLNVPYVAAWFFDRKPLPQPFLRGMEIMNSTPETTAAIGDQMFTDVVGANRLGIYSILIKPLGPDHWTTILTGRRAKERKILVQMGIIRE